MKPTTNQREPKPFKPSIKGKGIPERLLLSPTEREPGWYWVKMAHWTKPEPAEYIGMELWRWTGYSWHDSDFPYISTEPIKPPIP